MMKCFNLSCKVLYVKCLELCYYDRWEQVFLVYFFLNFNLLSLNNDVVWLNDCWSNYMGGIFCGLVVLCEDLMLGKVLYI